MDRSLILAVCAVFVFWGAAALSADEYVVVPKSVDEVTDAEFKQALSSYSANYQWLVRDNQVRDFVHVYKKLNNDREPNLSPEDRELLAQAARTVHVSEPQPVRYAPTQTTTQTYAHPSNSTHSTPTRSGSSRRGRRMGYGYNDTMTSSELGIIHGLEAYLPIPSFGW